MLKAIGLWTAALLCLPQATAGTHRYTSLIRFPATDTRPRLTFDLGRDLVLTVTKAVDAQGRQFGWDLSITDRRIPNSPNFFYGCLCGHGPTANDLDAWDFKSDDYSPNAGERVLPVWGYPYEIRVTCEACTVAGGDYMAAYFTGGTVDIGWRRLAVANRRQLRLSDIVRRHSPKHTP